MALSLNSWQIQKPESFLTSCIPSHVTPSPLVYLLNILQIIPLLSISGATILGQEISWINQ